MSAGVVLRLISAQRHDERAESRAAAGRVKVSGVAPPSDIVEPLSHQTASVLIHELT